MVSYGCLRERKWISNSRIITSDKNKTLSFHWPSADFFIIALHNYLSAQVCINVHEEDPEKEPVVDGATFLTCPSFNVSGRHTNINRRLLWKRDLFFSSYILIRLLNPRLYFCLCPTCRAQSPGASVSLCLCNICILIAHKQLALCAPSPRFAANSTISSQMSRLHSEPRNADIIHVPLVHHSPLSLFNQVFFTWYMCSWTHQIHEFTGSSVAGDRTTKGTVVVNVVHKGPDIGNWIHP